MSNSFSSHRGLADLTATEAIGAMASGDIRAETYAHALLDRAKQLERLNAFRTLNPEAVLAAARAADQARHAGQVPGALHGLLIPVKDSVNTRDLPTSNGTRALQNFQPREDAPALRPLFAAGAILMGKTNLHEISRGWTSNNGAFGAVLNPYDPSRVPGGSSGGSAAAVAARIAPLAVAEDTLGSIRVPSSVCGVAGLRPTFGRYSGAGIMALTLDKFDQVGPLARSVADLALFDTVVTGETRLPPARALAGVRIGISPRYFMADMDAEVERITGATLRKLREAGATLVEAEISAPMREALRIATAIIAFENRSSIAAYLHEFATGLSFDELLAQMSPNIQVIYHSFERPDRDAYHAALQARAQLQAATQEYFQSGAIDALAFPPILTTALPVGDHVEVQIDGKTVPMRSAMGRNTSLGSCASLASLVLPAGLTRSGLPVGIEFAALPGQDRELLGVGMAIEKVIGTLPGPAT